NAIAASLARFAEISKNDYIAQFLREGANLVKWQAFRTACVKIATLVGISIVASAAGSAVSRMVGGMLMRSGAATTVAELGLHGRLLAGGAGVVIDAAIAGGGQSLVFGDNYGEAFLENALISLGTHGVL